MPMLVVPGPLTIVVPSFTSALVALAKKVPKPAPLSMVKVPVLRKTALSRKLNDCPARIVALPLFSTTRFSRIEPNVSPSKVELPCSTVVPLPAITPCAPQVTSPESVSVPVPVTTPPKVTPPSMKCPVTSESPPSWSVPLMMRRSLELVSVPADAVPNVLFNSTPLAAPLMVTSSARVGRGLVLQLSALSQLVSPPPPSQKTAAGTARSSSGSSASLELARLERLRVLDLRQFRNVVVTMRGRLLQYRPWGTGPDGNPERTSWPFVHIAILTV